MVGRNKRPFTSDKAPLTETNQIDLVAPLTSSLHEGRAKIRKTKRNSLQMRLYTTYVSALFRLLAVVVSGVVVRGVHTDAP